MPARALQSSRYLVQTAAGGQLPEPAAALVLALTVPDGATANLDFTGIPGSAFRVIDAWAVKTNATAAASANTLQVQDAAGNPITDAMNMQVADQALVRAGSIDDARHAIAAGGGLRVRSVKAGQDCSAIVYVLIALT